ncbi:MAG: hypothetical protein O2865_16620 [Planctomycetota bacterium]|nr:hypothetical protein [Planctomycetota bacterium]MDA0932798.1 hypothetical protein [Planctomycetota bacterium]MDA1223262.1 hypothetical protein [Planctomycetota bacterium]
MRSLRSPTAARSTATAALKPLFAAAAVSMLAPAPTVTAQQMHVVPADLASQEGTSSFGVPGPAHRALRIQVIIGASELVPLIGKSVTGLWLRRDTSWEEELPAASGHVAIRIGSSARSPSSAEPSFAANLPASTLVFDGTVQLPAAPAVAEGSVSWSPDQTVRFAFRSAFPYAGGDLALEFERTGAPTTFWPADATEDQVSGTAVMVGTTCGPRASMQHTAGVGPRGLVVGRTARFHLVGTPMAPAWLMIGAGLRSVPVDLTALGAPGCALHVQPMTTLPTFLSTATDGVAGHGLTNVDVHLPPDPNLGGAILGAQFLEFGAQGLITSNAVLCQIATSGPSLPIAAVVSREGETPDVVSLALPVIGLIWQ